MRELEAVAEALRVEVALKDEALAAARDSVEAANARVKEMQDELDANATVFDLREQRRWVARVTGGGVGCRECPLCKAVLQAGARASSSTGGGGGGGGGGGEVAPSSPWLHLPWRGSVPAALDTAVAA
jgi:hypothetical protein